LARLEQAKVELEREMEEQISHVTFLACLGQMLAFDVKLSKKYSFESKQVKSSIRDH
jgi:hypothetical protein